MSEENEYKLVDGHWVDKLGQVVEDATKLAELSKDGLTPGEVLEVLAPVVGGSRWRGMKEHALSWLFLFCVLVAGGVGRLSADLEFARSHWLVFVMFVGGLVIGGFFTALFYPEPPEESEPDSE